MNNWESHQYQIKGETQGVSEDILEAAKYIAAITTSINSKLPPVFTLNHLARLSGIKFALLRAIVARKVSEPYRIFKIRKKSGKARYKRFRMICAPSPELAKVQSWICQNILNIARSKLHSASKAYAPESKIFDGARIHCSAKWLIKIDILNFFESISESSVYNVFRELGYQPLISFEMARICTRLFKYGTYSHKRRRWKNRNIHQYNIEDYRNAHLGYLPQGAPTSPMLANFAMIEADKELNDLAIGFGLVYSRYADDLTFSTSSKNFSHAQAGEFIWKVYRVIEKYGFLPNVTKTKIASPRSRKIVLGLLVDGQKPRLTRDFRSKMRLPLYYLKHPQVGPLNHAKKLGFIAVTGFKNHVYGLARYAYQVDEAYGKDLIAQLDKVAWPV